MSKSQSKKTQPIEINEEFARALDLMEKSSENVFVTGRAGTGKSTLLTYFRDNTRKDIAVLSPTGVGAVNVKGQTIHSFFGFKPNVTLNKIKKRYKGDNPDNIYKKIDAIVIDEISMARADLLDCVDKFLRLNGPSERKPFGGIQMVFIGDLYQLPPVVTGEEKEIFRLHYRSPYFFDATVFESFKMEFIELEKIYRQKDQKFIDLLNAVRNNSVTDEQIASLNSRCDPSFEPLKNDFYVYLTTTNAMADVVNSKRLEELTGRTRSFLGLLEGNFGKEYMPTSVDLKLKKGAQVMLLNNDKLGRWVNGTIGEITELEIDGAGDGHVAVRLSDGDEVDIEPFTWEIFKFSLEGNELVSKAIGSFTQFPIKLAWAMTIHKSQGKTFDRVIIDIGRGTFTHGQTYVALSRCVAFDGIILKKPILKKHIWMDWRVVSFLTKYQYKKSLEQCSLSEKVSMIERAIQSKSALKIIYLKSNDIKSKRRIKPACVGEMEYLGKKFLGVEAFCLERRENRVFRVDRILEIKEIGS